MQVGPITQGTLCFITPDFSFTMSLIESPITSTWSIPMDVIAEHIGLSTIFVASRCPPIPHSKTAKSAFYILNSKSAIIVTISKNLKSKLCFSTALNIDSQ